MQPYLTQYWNKSRNTKSILFNQPDLLIALRLISVAYRQMLLKRENLGELSDEKDWVMNNCVNIVETKFRRV